jgi:hypothetical protein
VQWQPGAGAWTYLGELGAGAFPKMTAPAATELVGAARVSGRFGPRWRVSAGGAREVFDEVITTIDDQVAFAGGDVDVGYAATDRLSLGIAASAGSATGRTVESSRTTAMLAARMSLSHGFGTALTHREVRWTEPAYGVFFAPQRFAITEASLSWHRPGDLGWIAGADLGVGTQGVRFESDPLTRRIVPRAVMRAGWRPLPGREVLATVVYANVAGAGAITASEYRYTALTLTARWTF